MNNYKNLLALVVVLVLGVVALRWEDSVTAQQQRVVQSTQVEYAQLMILDEKYTFVVSGTNDVARTFDLAGLYRNLGGRFRPTLVNLLGEIGEDGWRLAEISEDQSVYTFQR